MANETDEQIEFAAHLVEILGDPPLLKNEDIARYSALKAALREEMKPRTVFDEIHLQDLVGKIWEERRFKRTHVALIESALVQSLAALLAPADGENHQGALQDAQDYYSGDPEKSRPVEELLAKRGITPQHIEANAMHMRSVSFHMLDRMIGIRETARNSIIKNIERRQRKAAKRRNKQARNGHSTGSGRSLNATGASGWVPDEQ